MGHYKQIFNIAQLIWKEFVSITKSFHLKTITEWVLILCHNIAVTTLWVSSYRVVAAVIVSKRKAVINTQDNCDRNKNSY